MKKVYEALKQRKEPIYIYGAGEIAQLTDRKLKENHIPVAGFVVDDSYATDGAWKKTDLIGKGEPFVLIRAIWSSYFKSDADILSEWDGCQGVYQCADIYEGGTIEEISEAFYLSHKKSFDNVYDHLEDELSRASFQAFLSSKMENDNMYLIPYVVTPQYFFEDSPWQLGKNECLVDCGAYDGDSIMDFAHATDSQYAYIYALEPDVESCKAIECNMRKHNLENVEIVPKACGKEISVQSFTSNVMGIYADADGEITVEVDRLDNIVSGDHKVSIIKMDIEGAETDTLLGAKEIIQDDRPILMVSIYHKKDDLYRSFDIIDSMVTDYVYYLRIHKVLAVDIVLYAVPRERIK